jgi:hypothetical protein
VRLDHCDRSVLLRDAQAYHTKRVKLVRPAFLHSPLGDELEVALASTVAVPAESPIGPVPPIGRSDHIVGPPIGALCPSDPFETLVSVGRWVRWASRQSQLPEGLVRVSFDTRPACLGSWRSRVTTNHRRSADSQSTRAPLLVGGPRGRRPVAEWPASPHPLIPIRDRSEALGRLQWPG